MSAMPETEAPMSAEQGRALRRFEAFYPLFDQAINAEDADGVAALVEQRKGALAQLLDAFDGRFLPQSVRDHIEGSEALVHVRLMRFYDRILIRMSDARTTAFAHRRYQEKMK